jgi:hypothetical protein
VKARSCCSPARQVSGNRGSAALLERLAAEPHTRLRYFCSPQRGQRLSPDHRPDGTRRRPAHDDKPQTKLDKLDAVLTQTATSIEDAALLAEMPSLPNDGRYPALGLTPEQRRQKTLEALTSQLAGLARQKPSVEKSQIRPGRCRRRTLTRCRSAMSSSSKEARRRSRKPSMETTVERIVIMPATVGRWCKSPSFLGPSEI